MRTLVKTPLFMQSVATKEGLRRAAALVPREMKVCYMGAEPPSGEIFIFGTVPERALGEDGQPKPYTDRETAQMEFALVSVGEPVPEGYVFRAAVNMGESLLFLFEIRSGSPIIQV